MDGSLDWDARGTGSPLTSYGSPTVCWPSTGMSSRMRRLAQNRRVVCQCSALSSTSERGLNPEQRICIAVGFPAAPQQKDRTMSTQVVLITGGLTGIGRAAAVAFASKDAKVVVAGRRDQAGNALVK